MLPAALASLARSLLAQNRLDEALDGARQAYRMLEALGRVEDGEAMIRLVYSEILGAVGEEAASAAVLQLAARRLRERAQSISSQLIREAFLALPDHAATLSLASALGDAPPESAHRPAPAVP